MENYNHQSDLAMAPVLNAPRERESGYKIRSSGWFITTTVAMSIFTDIFLYSVVVPVLPYSLREFVHIKEDKVQYWVSLLLAFYGVGLFIASPIIGYLSDQLPTRKVPFLFGLLTQIGATLCLTLGKSLAVLAIGRLFQGMSCAVVWTIGLVILVDTYGPENSGSALSVVGFAMSTAIMLGPLYGGVIFDRVGYYAVYVAPFILLLIDITLRIFMIEKKPPISRTASPRMNDSTSTLAQSPPRHRHNNNTFLSGLRPFGLLLTSPRMLTALFSCTVQAIMITSFDSTLPLFVHSIFAWSSLGGGLIFAPFVLPQFIALWIGKWSDKFGPRWFCVAGFAGAAPLLALLRLVDHDSLGQKALLCVLIAGVGLCLTVGFTPVMAEVTYCISDLERLAPGTFGIFGAYAQGYALYNMAFAAGSQVGPAWGGLVRDAFGWDAEVWSIGLLSALTAVPCLFLTGGYILGHSGEWVDRTVPAVRRFRGGGGGGAAGDGSTDGFVRSNVVLRMGVPDDGEVGRIGVAF